MLSEEALNKVIECCEWRKVLYGVPICSGECGPCEKIIEAGKCSTLIDIFRETSEKKGDEVNAAN